MPKAPPGVPTAALLVEAVPVDPRPLIVADMVRTPEDESPRARACDDFCDCLLCYCCLQLLSITCS